MNANNKKSVVLKKTASPAVLYQEDNVTVYKEIEGNCFEIGDYFTHDVLEAVAILMKNPRLSKLRIWDYAFEIKNVNPINVIYWLSGVYMVHPRFEDEEGNLIPMDNPVRESGIARMIVINPDLIPYHKKVNYIGKKCYMVEGRRVTAICEIIEI